jgi:hypothetical protein
MHYRPKKRDFMGKVLLGLLLLGRRDRLHFCRIFDFVAALLARSETAAGIFPRSRLAPKPNLSPLIAAYPAAQSVTRTRMRIFYLINHLYVNSKTEYLQCLSHHENRDSYITAAARVPAVSDDVGRTSEITIV